LQINRYDTSLYNLKINKLHGLSNRFAYFSKLHDDILPLITFEHKYGHAVCLGLTALSAQIGYIAP